MSFQNYYPIQILVFKFALGESTIRRYIREGRFGPPPGENPNDYVARFGNRVRVTQKGIDWFKAHPPPSSPPTIRARTLGEARRKATYDKNRTTIQ